MSKIDSKTYHRIIRRISNYHTSEQVNSTLNKLLEDHHPLDAGHINAITTQCAPGDEISMKVIGHKALNPENITSGALAHARHDTLDGMAKWGSGEPKRLAKHRLSTRT